MKLNRQLSAAVVLFALLALMLPALHAQTNFSATAISSNKTALAWQRNSTDELQFQVWRGPTNGTLTALSALLPPTTLVYTDSTVAASSAYSYEVRSSYLPTRVSDTASVITSNAPAAAPPSTNGVTLYVKRYGSTGNDRGYAVATDRATEQLLFAGTFTTSADFGGGAVNGSSLVTKRASNGDYVWQKAYSGADVSCRAVTVDSASNVVVVGTFTGTLNAGAGSMVSTGSFDIFVAKYAGATGTCLWSKRFGSTTTGGDAGLAVATDVSNNVVIAGQIMSGTDLGVTNAPALGTLYGFVAKLSGTNGALAWGRITGKGAVTGVAASALNPSNDVILAGGTFSGTNDFGGGAVAAQATDGFVVQYTTAGEYGWSQTFGGTAADAVAALAIDAPSSNVFVTGTFQNIVNFGTGAKTNSGTTAAFLLKYNASGSNLWVKTVSATGAKVEPASVAVGTNGVASIGGTVEADVNFGAGNLAALGSTDIFVASYTGAGTLQWAHRYGGATTDRGLGVAIAGTGETVVTGSFRNKGTFGTASVTSTGADDIFLLKLSP